jgi:secretion/DNA translocation related CpaE-like protein
LSTPEPVVHISIFDGTAVPGGRMTIALNARRTVRAPSAEGASVASALVIARDRELLSDLDRVAAVAGCELELADGVSAGRRSWAAAPLVLLDADALDECATAGLSRRPGVLVLCRGEPPSGLWQQAVGVGAENVLALPACETALVNALADAVEDGGRSSGRVVVVVGGRGGAGASVFAAALALVAQRRSRRALLVDCDPLGGGVDYLLGAEHADGLRWPQLGLSGGRVAASALHAALPSVAIGGHRLTVLSCGRDGQAPSADAVAAVIDAGRRAGDTVVCDVPRHLPEAASSALDRADLVVLVVPAEVRACAAATPLAERLRLRGSPVRLVVRGPAPGGLAPADVSQALDLPLLAAMRPAPGLVAALDAGKLPLGSSRSPLARAAGAVLDALAGDA